MGRETIKIEGLWLRREGDHVVVLAEVDGNWVEVIREHVDGSFSHIVEPDGIALRADIAIGAT